MRLGFLLPWKHTVSIGGGEGMMSFAFTFLFQTMEFIFKLVTEGPLWVVVESMLPSNHIGLGM